MQINIEKINRAKNLAYAAMKKLGLKESEQNELEKNVVQHLNLYGKWSDITDSYVNAYLDEAKWLIRWDDPRHDVYYTIKPTGEPLMMVNGEEVLI